MGMSLVEKEQTKKSNDQRQAIPREKKEITHLGVFLRNSIEDGLVCAVGEAAVYSRLLVLFVSVPESLGTKIIGIAKRFVHALKSVSAGHEDLDLELVDCAVLVGPEENTHPLKSSRTCPGMGSHKNGLVRHDDDCNFTVSVRWYKICFPRSRSSAKGSTGVPGDQI